jgi:hypothetical protein
MRSVEALINWIGILQINRRSSPITFCQYWGKQGLAEAFTAIGKPSSQRKQIKVRLFGVMGLHASPSV